MYSSLCFFFLAAEHSICVCVTVQGLLAEDEGEVVFRLLLVSQVFETKALQKA